jgi:two-component system chemotaxis response regulator CheB
VIVNPESKRRDVIVVGASAGGVTALMELFAALPPTLPAAIAAVLHRSPHVETQLPRVMNLRSRIPVSEPEDGEPFTPGRIYVAPRDVHMVVDDARLRLRREPREHRTRPAVDPLFRTAARAYGARVAGVLLTGGGSDGVEGLVTIKTVGGVSIAQDPREAFHPSMPLNAIVYDHVDAVLHLAAIADALTALAHGQPIECPEMSSRRPRPGGPL